MWAEVLKRFERQAPVSVMARVALQQALPAQWIDDVFEANRQRQYPRELLMSSVVELMLLVSLGLRPSLHAAARKLEQLPVSLTALYDKVNRTEPQVLRALVQGSAARLTPVIAQVGAAPLSLPGLQLRIIDGNHLPASEKRLAPLREQRGAAMPGHTVDRPTELDGAGDTQQLEKSGRRGPGGAPAGDQRQEINRAHALHRLQGHCLGPDAGQRSARSLGNRESPALGA